MNEYYTKYYLNQSAGGLADIGDLYRAPVFIQRGRGGEGSFFVCIWRHIQPFVTSGARALRDQAVKSTAIILNESTTEKSLKDILKDEGKAAAKSLAMRSLRRMQGGRRVRKPIKRLKKPKNRHSTKKKRIKKAKRVRSKKHVSKKNRLVDIFNN